MNREEKIAAYAKFKVVHLARIMAHATLKVGDKVKISPAKGKNLLCGIVFEIEKVDLDHTHGGFDGYNDGHTETCYSERYIDYHLVAYADDGRPIRTRYHRDWLLLVSLREQMHRAKNAFPRIAPIVRS